LSVEAISWALAQPLDRSSAKFVLVAMANCANADMTCWPSVAYLSEATCQDRKTVLENIKRLKDIGIIRATDERRGKTGQVTVYLIDQEYQKRDASTVPKTAPVPKTVPVPKTDAKSPVFPAKESRFSAETGPKTGHGTVREPSIEPSGNRQKVDRPDDVSPEVWADFSRLRTAKKAPISATAIAGIRREADKAGWSMQSALEQCCERGWTGFKADWVREQPAGGRGAPVPVNRQEAIEQRNQAVGKRWAAQQQEVFDDAP